MIHIRESIGRWLRGDGDGKDWHMCADCNGSRYVIEATHIEDGYTEMPGDDETWDWIQEDDFYFHKERVVCPTCSGTGAYHYDGRGNLLPDKEYRFDRAKNNGWVDYRAYIKSPEWRIKATEAKRLAGWRCQICNRGKDEVILDAHHRTYDRLGEERVDDITVLCRDCHNLYERNKKQRRVR